MSNESMKLSNEIRSRARGYTVESVNFQWIEAGVIINWADRAAELEAERDTALAELAGAVRLLYCQQFAPLKPPGGYSYTEDNWREYLRHLVTQAAEGSDDEQPTE